MCSVIENLFVPSKKICKTQQTRHAIRHYVPCYTYNSDTDINNFDIGTRNYCMKVAKMGELLQLPTRLDNF